jgi:hypothetical protein
MGTSGWRPKVGEYRRTPAVGGPEMRLQENRNTSHRTFGATATDLPINAATTSRTAPVVAVFGHPGRVAGLPAHLPTGWSLRRPAGLDDVQAEEIVLFAGATEQDVLNARAVLPRRTRVVALVDDDAPAELVAAVLTAGADVCVRGGLPAILASHLVACRRRQLADRWSALQATLAIG